jgi:hypothetical protein
MGRLGVVAPDESIVLVVQNKIGLLAHVMPSLIVDTPLYAELDFIECGTGATHMVRLRKCGLYKVWSIGQQNSTVAKSCARDGALKCSGRE